MAKAEHNMGSERRNSAIDCFQFFCLAAEASMSEHATTLLLFVGSWGTAALVGF